MEQKLKFDITKHILVPKHTKVTNKEEIENLLKTYNVSKKQLPRMLKTDPAIQHLTPESGDVIKVERNSPTASKTIIYRVVV